MATWRSPTKQSKKKESKDEKRKDRGPDRKIHYLKNRRPKKREHRKWRERNQRINLRNLPRKRRQFPDWKGSLKLSTRYENTCWNVSPSNLRTPGTHSKVTKSFQRGKRQDSYKEQSIRTASHFNISTEKKKTKEQCLQNSEKKIFPTLKLLPKQTWISTKHQSKI